MGKTHALSIILLGALLFSACHKEPYFQFQGPAQGDIYRVKYKGASIKPAELQIKVDSLLTEIDNTLSGYNSHSLLSQFNSGDSIILSPMFFDLYELSYDMWERSEGAFDVACGPLFDLWGFGFKASSDPTEEQIKECLGACGTARLKKPSELKSLIGEKIRSTDLLRKGENAPPQLNFNAIAQGYSCDAVADLLKKYGVKDMLVDIGEIYCCGNGPSGLGWTIAVDNPVDGNNTPGADIKEIWNSEGQALGVVTSGNYRKFYIKDGKKYSHTIDPRTGYPVSHSLLSATVTAPNASEADALATFFMVIGKEESIEYLCDHPHIHAFLISEDGVWKNW